MIVFLLLIIPIGIYFDLPLLPVILGAAIMQSIVAYILTKHQSLLRLAGAVSLIGVTPFVLPIIFEADTLKPSLINIFETCSWGASILTIISSTFIGLFGLPELADNLEEKR